MTLAPHLAIRQSSIETAKQLRSGIREHLGDASEVDFLRESFERITNEILRFEDQYYGPLFGWVGAEEKGFKLEEIKKIALYAEKQVKTNALLGRGLRLKNNHAFGRGFRIENRESEGKVQTRFQNVIDDPDNQEVLFSSTAMKKNNRILFNSGNLFIVFDSKTKKFSRAAVDMHIKNYIAYDDDPERVKYYLHSYKKTDDLNGGTPEEVQTWIPVSTYKESLPKEAKRPASLPIGGGSQKRVPVDWDKVIIDLRVNNDSGEIWGTPDCLSALPWAWASSEYLRDGSKLLKALSTLAYQVKAKTEAGQNRAGAQVSRSRVAGTAITGTDTEINALPRANAVDLYTGRPLQAQVAAALDVSVTSLTGDTAKGGSNGAESTLSLPEQLAALSRQEDFSGFMVRAFRAMGAPDLRLNFNRLAVDPIHRQMQTAGLARTLGGISQKELRRISLELLDINGDVDDLPEPDEFTGSKYSTLAEQVDAGLENDEQNSDPNARQGNSGDVGSVTDNNELRDTDAAGTQE